MTEVIKKTWNSYSQHEGYIMGFERSEQPGVGHRVSVMDQEQNPITFQWRGAVDPAAGQRVTVIMVKDGVSIRRDRPVLVLNHETGDVIREQNAPPPKGSRPVMLSLWAWILIALSVACLLIANTEGLTRLVTILVGTALIVWRLAIATSELRADDRAQKRIQDEEKLCLEIMTSEWRASGQRIDMMRKEAP